MKSLLIMAAAAAAAVALSGCQDKKPEPVPGPQSLLSARQARDHRSLAPLSIGRSRLKTSSRGSTSPGDCYNRPPLGL